MRGEITLLYGEAATGKTTAAIQAAVCAAAKGSKVLFIDCDNSFTLQRFNQINANNRSHVEHLMLFFPSTFEEQRILVETLDNYVTPTLSLVIVDSISTLYRAEFKDTENIFNLNRNLTRQLAYLANLTLKRKIACLITSQVHARFKTLGDQVEPVARRALVHFPKTIIKIRISTTPRVREFILERFNGANANGCCLVEITEHGLENVQPEPF